MSTPFHRPVTHPESARNVQHLVGDPDALLRKEFTKSCEAWFEQRYPGYRAFMTTSCTRALELAALSIDIRPGDEIILSPYNYVGVANAFANYGAKLVFVDVDPATMNIDARAIEAAITDRTRAVLAMHYGGVGCDMRTILDVCQRHDVLCIEDAALSIGATLNGQPLGSFGDISAISFDSMKNITCGEGGVLLVQERFVPTVEVAFENGTDKRAFERGQVPAYTWTARGSKFALSEFNAAVLLPLLENEERITRERRARWDALYDALAASDFFSPMLPNALRDGEHNGHVFWLLAPSRAERDELLTALTAAGVPAAFHYQVLDGGQEVPRAADLADRVVRLPVHHIEDVVRAVERIMASVEGTIPEA